MVRALLRVRARVLGELAEEDPEERPHEWPRQVKPLVGVVVAVVLRPPAKRAQQEPVQAVAQEVGLLGLHLHLVGAHVRQQLLGKDLARILDARLSRHANRRPALANEVQRHVLALDHERLLDRRPQHVEHRLVLEVIHDVLQDVLVRHKAQRAEDDDHGDLLPDVGDGHLDCLPRRTARACPCKHLQEHGGSRAVALLHQ
mmetsp:Transcript_6455/g.19395  ORF Transcript_6455/g.19395 Transcript_6455/m.19395 type:complete len:201 (-) Transcript_6455:880-1482(-)